MIEVAVSDQDQIRFELRERFAIRLEPAEEQRQHRRAREVRIDEQRAVGRRDLEAGGTEPADPDVRLLNGGDLSRQKIGLDGRGGAAEPHEKVRSGTQRKGGSSATSN